MTPFDGLETADFEFFDTLDAGYKTILRSRLQLFGDAVHEKLPSDLRHDFPGPVFVPRWSGSADERPCAIIGREDIEKGPFKHTNFILRLEPDGLHVNVVIRNGRYGDKKSPIHCLARAIDTSPDRFVSLITGLGAGHAVYVFERKPIRGDRIMPGNEKWVPKCCVQADAFNDQAKAKFRKMLETIEFPGIQIGLHVPKDPVLEMPGSTLVRTAVSAIMKLYWVIRFAESGIRG